MRHWITWLVTQLFLLVGLMFAQQTPVKPEWVLVGGQPIHWDSPPRGTHIPIKTSPASILIFNPNGDFAELGCLLIRQKDGTVLISHGDGFVVGAGRWTHDANSVTVMSRVVYRTVPMVGGAKPESEEQRIFALRIVGGKWELNLSGRKFRPMPELTDLNTLAGFVGATYDEH